MKYNLRTSALSLAAVLVLGMSGCGGGSSSSEDDGVTTSSTTAVSGKAIDGYLVYATVCLDISNDGYCQIGVEPVASTDENGSFSLSVTAEQKAEPGYATAPLLVYGGYDADTNADFTGKLKAPFNNGAAEINVTPISTMVEAMIAQGEDVDTAEAAVKQMLNLPEETDLGADPVESADTNPQLLRAALQLQKSLEVLADALSAAGATENSHDLVEGLYDGLAEQLATSTDLNLTEALGEVVANHADLDGDALSGATSVAGQIELLVDEDGVSDTAVIGTQIGAIQEEIVVNVIDGNSSIDDLDFDSITSKSFALLHAEEILRIVDFEGEDTAFDTLATKVKDTLVDAGMPSDSFLPVVDEIAALKASVDTEVQDIGVRFEARMTGFETEADDLDTFANAQAIPFDIPMSIYNFYEDEGYFGYHRNTLSINGAFEEVEMRFNPTSNEFEVDTNNDGYMRLLNGMWIQGSASTYTISADRTLLDVGGLKVKLIKKINLANPASEDEDVLEEVNEKVPGDNVSFSNGSEAYVLAFQKAESYEMDTTAVRDWNSTDVNASYADLQSFFDSKTGTNLVAYNDEYGMSFDIPSGGVTIEAGASGTLSKYSQGDANNSPVFIAANAGIWEVKYIPGTTELAIFITPNDPEYWDWQAQQFYGVYEGAVHEGEYVEASDAFNISEELEYNEAAFNDIVSALTAGTADAGGSSSDSSIAITESLLAGKVFYDGFVEVDNGATVTYYAKTTIDSATQATRHEQKYNAEGNLLEEWTATFDYQITADGVMKVITPDEDKYFTLTAMTDEAWNFIISNDENQDGSIENSDDTTWFLNKPVGYPENL